MQLEKQGGYGWKLDVQYPNGDWHFPGGDQVEETLDELMPYLSDFIDDSCQWFILGSNEPVSFDEISAT